MTAPDPQAAFLRFRDAGDPAALAQVFDALAPRLLLLALHLCRNRADAEDLVQETFVAAMAAADRYDPERDLGRWFAGILGKRSLELRRRRSRAEPAVAPESVQNDPLTRAADREVLEQVDRALAVLPAAQREVLVLRLHHGLTGREIARALGRSIDTVHTQIRRGLEALRQRLPSSLGIAAAMVVEGERGVGQVRAGVLARVPRTAAVAGSGGVVLGTFATLMTMKKALLACAALALLAVGWSFVPRSEAATVPALAGPSSGSALADARVDASSPDRGGEALRAVVEAAPREAAPATTPEPAVLGRCVDRTDGLAVGGADVRMNLSIPPDRPGDHMWTRETRETRSGPDGAFSFADPIPVGARLELHISAAGFAAFKSDNPTTVKDESTIELGDLALVRGWQAGGRVVDVEGRPLGKVIEFTLRVTPEGWQLGDDLCLVRITTDASGAVQHEKYLPPGHLEVTPMPEWRVVSCEPGRFEGGRAWPTLTIVLEPNPQQISGVVVDRQDQPIADAIVQAYIDGESVGNTVTDENGRFTLYADSEVRGDCALRAHETIHGPRPGERCVAAWGDTDVRLQIPRATRIELHVTDARTGRPLDQIGVDIEHASGGGGISGNMPDGCFPVAVQDGHYLLAVEYVGAMAYAPALVEVHAPADHLRTLEVPLEPLASRHILVVDEDGVPAAASRVRVVRSLTPDPSVHGPWLPRGRGVWGTERPNGLVLDETETDRDGLATIRSPRAEDRAWLLVEGSHQPYLALLESHSEGPHTIVIARDPVSRSSTRPTPTRR